LGVTARRPLPYPRPPEPDTPPARVPERRRPTRWLRALLGMLLVLALLWAVQVVNAADDYRFDRFGLKPREVDGLWGVAAMPLLHASYHHLLANTVPLLAIGWVLLLSGVRVWGLVTAVVVLVGGLLTWLVAPSHTVIVGASGLIFGWLGYLLARAYFSRALKWIAGAVVLLVFFGSLFVDLTPSVGAGVSWQAHLCGFGTGVALGALLHPRRGATRSGRRAVVG
jgi:membrane associated rhomboid family serine protease